MPVELKVMSGYLSCSKKSPESRWPLRCSLRVSTLATFTVAVALLFSGFAPSMWISPSNSLKPPRTLVTMACRAMNPTELCATSKV